jgi:hypothetical protein
VSIRHIRIKPVFPPTFRAGEVCFHAIITLAPGQVIAVCVNFALSHFFLLKIYGVPDLFSETIPEAVRIAYVTGQRVSPKL